MTQTVIFAYTVRTWEVLRMHALVLPLLIPDEYLNPTYQYAASQYKN